MVSFLDEVKIFRFGKKPWTIYNKAFCSKFRSFFEVLFYSTVEGAMKLKFVSFCSS